jgi:hypothetical protein
LGSELGWQLDFYSKFNTMILSAKQRRQRIGGGEKSLSFPGD